MINKSTHSFKNVKSGFLALTACGLMLAAAPASAQTLTQLGTDSWQIDPGSIVNLTYTQNSTNTTVTIAFGGTIGGLFTAGPFDWSSVTEFGLLMSVPGLDPLQSFSIEFFNSNILESDPALQVNYYVAQFLGDTTGVSDVLSVLTMTKNESWVPPTGGSGGLDDFTDIVGMQFTWGNPTTGGTSPEATLGGIAVVPEPSTWALLVCGGALLGGMAWRRRLATARR